ncbi:MAG: hypothetical protein R6V37_10455 [Psychroflexus maritimus]
MNQIDDLNIENEICSLFDFTLNNLTRDKLIDLLNNPLKSVEEIKMVQSILKGFLQQEVLNDYTYPVLYFNEMHAFLKSEIIEAYTEKPSIIKWFASSTQTNQLKSKLSQLILLFYKLQQNFFSKIDVSKFPTTYTLRIRKIQNFFNLFDLVKNEEKIRERGLNKNEINSLLHQINKLKKNQEIQLFWDRLIEFETYLSISKGISKNNFQFPAFSKNQLSLNNLINPFIKNPVNYSLTTTKNVIVLNGPNMSGKSTFLKTVATCVYLSHLGLAVPAQSAKIPFFSNFIVILNKKDNSKKGYSQFMNELHHLKKTLSCSIKSSCFAIFDELFSSTNQEDMNKIMPVTIKGLTKFNSSCFFISTHHQSLKENQNNNVLQLYLDVEMNNGTPNFTYQLKEGWSDLKLGSILFESSGLKELLKK